MCGPQRFTALGLWSFALQTILLCFDGSKQALKALQIASDLTEKHRGRLIVLEVLPLKGDDKKGRGALDGANAVADHFQPVIEKLKKRGIENYKLELDRGEPVASILLAARRHEASTVVMGCRGLGQSDHEFGSVSQSLFSQLTATCIAVK